MFIEVTTLFLYKWCNTFNQQYICVISVVYVWFFINYSWNNNDKSNDTVKSETLSNINDDLVKQNARLFSVSGSQSTIIILENGVYLSSHIYVKYFAASEALKEPSWEYHSPRSSFLSPSRTSARVAAAGVGGGGVKAGFKLDAISYRCYGATRVYPRFPYLSSLLSSVETYNLTHTYARYILSFECTCYMSVAGELTSMDGRHRLSSTFSSSSYSSFLSMRTFFTVFSQISRDLFPRI